MNSNCDDEERTLKSPGKMPGTTKLNIKERTMIEELKIYQAVHELIGSMEDDRQNELWSNFSFEEIKQYIELRGGGGRSWELEREKLERRFHTEQDEKSYNQYVEETETVWLKRLQSAVEVHMPLAWRTVVHNLDVVEENMRFLCSARPETIQTPRMSLGEWNMTRGHLMTMLAGIQKMTDGSFTPLSRDTSNAFSLYGLGITFVGVEGLLPVTVRVSPRLTASPLIQRVVDLNPPCDQTTSENIHNEWCDYFETDSIHIKRGIWQSSEDTYQMFDNNQKQVPHASVFHLEVDDRREIIVSDCSRCNALEYALCVVKCVVEKLNEPLMEMMGNWRSNRIFEENQQ